MPDVGDGDTATLTVSPHDGSTTAALTLRAPDGTSSSVSVATTDGGATWTGVVTYTMSGWWVLDWTVTGTGFGRQFSSVFVTDPPEATAVPVYVGRELLKEQLSIPADDTTRDNLLDLALRTAARRIDKDCSRVFYRTTTPSSRIYDLPGRSFQARDGEVLLTDDIATASGLVVETGNGTDWFPVSSTLYRTYPDDAFTFGGPIEGVRHIQRYGWTGAGAIFRLAALQVRVTVDSWGYPAVPEDVQMANLLQATRFYLRRQTPEGVAGSSEWGVIRMSNLDPDVRQMLKDHRRPGFGGRG